jgi:hypothetical protein
VAFSVLIRWTASWVHFEVADLAEEFADASALGADLGVGCLERVLSVQRPLSPGRFTRVVSLDEKSAALVNCLPDCFSDSGFRICIGVEKRPGHSLHDGRQRRR